MTLGNFMYGQKYGYSDQFKSAQQIRNYLSNNVATLDPLEGEYDIDSYGEYITPFVHQYYPHSDSKLFIVCNNNKFKVYSLLEGQFNETYLSIKPIGETNAYWMYFHSTSTRIYLQNNISFKATFKLDNSTAKKFTKNNNLSTAVNIILYDDCIKVYPTATMYANATKKAVEEAQPKEWTGTGFALNSNYIVTNNHVVDGAKTINVQGINGDFNHKYSAQVVSTDKVNDLAIIKVNGTTIPSTSIPYAVKVGTAEVGEEVFVLGYPLTSTMGEEIKLTTGVISSKTGFQGDVSIYQISAPIQPGNSGGPLFDSKGNVIGIVSAKHQGAENVGYAIKTSYLRNLMESAVSTNILPQTNKMAGQNLSGKVKLVKNYVYYITCLSSGNETKSVHTYEANRKVGPSSDADYSKYLGDAQNGDPVAQYIIGRCFHFGYGVAADLKNAVVWYSKAAEQGNALAQNNLGHCYQNGIGIGKDISKAIFWFRKAAEQGNISAQNNLGACYYRGEGVNLDYNQAAYWFKKAADQGSDTGRINYEAVKRKIGGN